METAFPIELLQQTPKRRKDYFDKLVISHPNLEKAYKELLSAINNASSQNIIFLYGPTGVGKTTLRNRVRFSETYKL